MALWKCLSCGNCKTKGPNILDLMCETCGRGRHFLVCWVDKSSMHASLGFLEIFSAELSPPYLDCRKHTGKPTFTTGEN